ncbi:TNF receptor-associated factor 6-like [Clavelina lepadiformis]|uniref:TNF receptor-associated factor 6-like n=1 Tax=Clavelina lepadiformis TaxID=159417 RepID=UPI004041BEF5
MEDILEQRSPMSSPDVVTNETNGFDQGATVGYDYEFIPTLDNKYMCPICLLALRDPVQTSCGHRFCHLCILRCIRNQARCPVDQIPLSSKQLFQDRSAHREVLDLKVKCSNDGCDVVLELRHMQKHHDICPFLQVPCKYYCGVTFALSESHFHYESQCTHRPVRCSVCQQTYPLNAAMAHEEDCKQHEPVECEHCKHKFKRYRLNQHISGECPQAPIKCVFDNVGCHKQHPRHHIEEHMKKSTQVHLQYLLSTVTALQKQSNTLQENLIKAQENFKTFNVSSSQSAPLSQVPPSTKILDLDELNCTITNINLYDSDSEIHHDTSPATEVDEKDEFDEIALIKASHKQLEERYGRSASSSSSVASSPVVLPNTFNTTDVCTCKAAAGLKVLQNKHTDHDEKIVSLDHHVRELVAKMENQVLQMKDINTKLSAVEQRLEQQELRCCNGLYYWKIKEYAKLRRAATIGDMPVLHSPGFYTSPQGYRMCIRANLDGVENAQGTHLSLFVHIMKGEYDDFLTWPFYGTITLTIINQRELPSQRMNISETLEARSNLMAFQRPTTERNQKGYGYIDFYPLRMLETNGFTKNNTLVIKAQVRVYENPVK